MLAAVTIQSSFMLLDTGKEVAKFCQDYIAQELVKSQDYRQGNYEAALRVSFLE